MTKGIATTDNIIVNYCLKISYDGQNYFGWQRHGNKPTIQYAIEEAIYRTFGVECKVIGSGRTDRGAHATGQIANVFLPLKLELPEAVAYLNKRLPDEIRILELTRVPDNFHARESAVGKLYRYVIWNTTECPKNKIGRVWHIPAPLDIKAIYLACQVFQGKHDFASFATKPKFNQKTTVRIISRINIDFQEPQLSIFICANSFLYKMVRNIVRAIVKVGEGRYTLQDIEEILLSKNRKSSPGTAPASGLFLDEVYY